MQGKPLKLSFMQKIRNFFVSFMLERFNWHNQRFQNKRNVLVNSEPSLEERHESQSIF